MKLWMKWVVILTLVIGVCVFAVVGKVWFGLNIWVAVGMAILAVFLTGIVATVEDEAPGGFNNPRPRDRKP